MAVPSNVGPKIRDGETTIKIKFAVLRGGREENRPKTLFFVGNHDHKILKVQIL